LEIRDRPEKSSELGWKKLLAYALGRSGSSILEHVLNISASPGWGVMPKVSSLGVIAFLVGGSLLAWGKEQKTIKYRNTAPGVAYTGSKSCADSGCHEQTYRNYYRTPHGNSMGPANAPSDLAKVPDRIKVYAKKQDRYFETVREGSDLYQTQYQLEKNGKRVFASAHKLEYRIGGHLTGSTYLIRWGQHLFEAPLSYYVRVDQWDLSPGYEDARRPFNRPIILCPYCHNGQPEPVPNRAGMYRDPPFRFMEYGIGCECCHGPGELHVQKRSKHPKWKSRKVDTTIVNPARLSPSLADDICIRCHEGWAARVVQPGKSELDFRPGSPLYETVALFKTPVTMEQRAELDRLEVLPPTKGSLATPMWFKHSLMEMSRCFRDSNGQLSCITCHVHHDPPTEENKVAYYRERCFTCHTNESCKLPLPERMRQEPANDCVGCHMPRKGVAGIPHSDDTNHRIVRRAGQPYPDYAFEESDPELPGLVCINRRGKDAAKPIPPLTKLRAYNEVMVSKKADVTRYYLEVLEQLRKSSPDEPAVLACLGRKALFEKDNAKAVQYLTRALERGAYYDSTYLDLSEALARVGRLEECAKILEQGVAAWPFSADMQQALVLCYMKLNRLTEAGEALKRYVALFPEDAFGHEALVRANKGNP
jgi:hypothetical protein